MALRNEMLESNVGAPGLRIRPSKFGREENDDVEPPTESDNGDRGEVVHHATTTRDYCQRTEIPRMIDGTHQYALNGTRGDAREIASPAFPLSRKRRGVARPESPSQGSSACDDQASCLKKVSDSRPCHNRRVTQERRPQKPLSVSQRSKVRTRSLSHNLPLGPDKWQHNVEEVVWEYGHLLHYRIVNGNPQVLVPWVPTWEPAGEYPPEDVDRVRRESQAQKQARRRGRPRSKHYTQL